MLAELGENLVQARSGDEALARLMEAEFAVILLDVNMPGMDGFETASLIHQHPRHEKTPIIFVTAVHITDLDRIRGYNLGAVDYVFVPVVPEILRSKVAVLCELYRQRRELQRLNRTLGLANEELAHANAALQAEKALELRTLNETLERTNRDLAVTNTNLQGEIADRRRVEEKLREADRRKDEFLATLAHELRNPLAPIRNAPRLLQIDDREAASEPIHIMERQLRQLVRLIDDLLDVAREVRVVYDPLLALQLAAGFEPHIVFMDVGMPGMSGYDLARLMRAQPWSTATRLVALTGWGQAEDRRRSREAGFDHHLVKPAEFSEIERLCDLHRRVPAGGKDEC